MVSYNKITSIQDSFWVSRQSDTNNHEDTLKLSQEMFSLVSPLLDNEGCVEVQLYKQDFIQSIFSIIKSLNDIKIKNNANGICEYDNNFYERYILPIEYFFGQQPKKKYKVKLRDTTRMLMAFPQDQRFSPRLYFVDGHSNVEIIQYESGTLGLKVTFVDNVSQHGGDTISVPLNLPLQQIFYGAPGTGKSHGIQEAEDDFAKVIRTTFHPDSDYSTFVGAYKPVKREQKIYSVNELAALWGSMYPTFPNRPEIRFASNYYKSLIAAGSAQYPNIFIGANTNVVNAEVPKGIAAAESYEKTVGGGEITYDFTPQAFTQAYIEAWKRYEKGEAVLLVIEEINRGNCAQIFGDLFQLLDRRDDGFSSYPIVPDTDLQRFVAGQGICVSGVQDARGNDISAEICNGTKLLLPPNLFIWATMNTSDQSLFPIDSAFKRRWDWKYTKIKEGKDDAGQPLGWTLNFVDDPNNQGQKLCWWDFIKKLNTIIESMTDSADKQLGYFFCKANDAKEITPEVFVGKVVFYLWNDVFKMCGFNDKLLFTYERDNNGTKEKAALTFPDFYNEEGDVDSEVAKQFVLNVMNWKKN